jgi:CheY-like chemotaxis protein
MNVPSTDTSQSWATLILGALAIFFGGGTIATIINAIVNRRKPQAEIHETEARAVKALAEARNLDATTNKTAADVTLEMIRALRAAEENISELVKEKEKYKTRAEIYERKERRRLSMEAQRPRVLLVEDNDDMRDLLSIKFRDSPFRLECARDGTEALEQYDEAIRLGFPFRVLILDYAMPGLSGIEVAVHVRKSGDNMTKIIFHTAYPAYVAKDDVAAYGILDVIAKGDGEELGKALSRAVK